MYYKGRNCLQNNGTDFYLKLVTPAGLASRNQYCLKKFENTRCSSFAVVFGLLVFFFQTALAD